VRTIAIVNQKGGCGKTTTAINLAALYARRGLRTLLVDMDPQSHCAAGLGVPESRIEYSIGDALLASHQQNFDASPLLWEVSRNLHLAPSTMKLSALEAPGGGLHQMFDKDRRLESLLGILAPRFDRCLIDCPPTLGLLTFNALRAAREALIPVETGFFSMKGAERQWSTIQRLIGHIGRPIACHLLATLHDPGSRLATNILAALRRQFPGQIVPVVIHDDEALREAVSFGQPVIEFAPDSQARRDFDALADWLEEQEPKPSVHIEIMLGTPPQLPAGTWSPGSPELIAALGGLPVSPFGQPEPDQQQERSGSGGRGRAAELALRMQAKSNGIREAAFAATGRTPLASDAELQLLGAGAATATGGAPPVAAPALEIPLRIEESPSVSVARTESPAHLFGVRQTAQGILFVQPLNGTRALAIAGEFNHWSATAHPLRINADLGVFEMIVKLPPGKYQYRLVVDGRWIADSYNPQTQFNSYGEPNSVITVR